MQSKYAFKLMLVLTVEHGIVLHPFFAMRAREVYIVACHPPLLGVP